MDNSDINPKLIAKINYQDEIKTENSLDKKTSNEIEIEYQLDPNLNSNNNNKSNEKEADLNDPNMNTAAGPLQTGSTAKKKVTFAKEDQIFLVESFKKYNRIGNQENCCECQIF